MNHKPGQPQQPASQKDENAVAFAQGMFDLARNGGTELLRPLLDAGIPVNLRTSEGETLLMLASRNGHVEAVRLLLEKGADPDARNHQGDTARALAKTDSVRDLFSASNQ
ncbi:ankyrin repeat domain-containing protein [Marinobacter sp.]|uniref:ankyrin repeat domain-containing protein n=1 Tax=Marinobacter sp. TaxID=50741 RepID=UPI0034A364C1